MTHYIFLFKFLKNKLLYSDEETRRWQTSAVAKNWRLSFDVFPEPASCCWWKRCSDPQLKIRLFCFFLPPCYWLPVEIQFCPRPAVKKLSVWRTRVFTVHYFSVIVSCVCFEWPTFDVCLVTRAPESWSPAPSLTSPLRPPLTSRWAETKTKKEK